MEKVMDSNKTSVKQDTTILKQTNQLLTDFSTQTQLILAQLSTNGFIKELEISTSTLGNLGGVANGIISSLEL
jgi:hypothetical protein